MIALAAAGCSVLVDPDRRQCSVNGDCKRFGVAYADATCVEEVCVPNPAWSCVGRVKWPAPKSGKFTARLPLTDLVTEQPAKGITARVCRKLDVDCTQPVSSGAVSDESGTLAVELEAGFDGYIELRGPGYMPGLYFFYPPIDADREVQFLPLLSPAVFGQFVMLAGHEVEPDRGHLLLGAYDCRNQPAEGVRFSSQESDDKTFAFYLIKRIPNVSAKVTDSAGRGGLVNLRAGPVSLIGSVDPGDRRWSKLSVIVRPGALTYTTIVPSPD
jgi:hypothetical protein